MKALRAIGLGLGLTLAAAPVAAQDALSLEDQARLASRFAPVLLYHPGEEYFPSSPVFPLRAAGPPGPIAASVVSLLGTPESRVSRYRTLTMEEKADLATVYYRAYPSRHRGESVIVLEYWLYYVRNEYRLRANIIPIWYDGSHPNDLEHVHVVLSPGRGETPPRVIEILASAHEGHMPANRYRYPEPTDTGPLRFLVERGSHALAPDVDGNGTYTPGHDGDSGHKMIWGVRDNGALWTRYSTDYMAPRSGADTVVFGYEGTGSGSFSYQLVHVDELDADMGRLGLSEDERRQVFESDIHWFRRVFGGNNGSASSLLVPPQVDSEKIGIQDLSSTERGILAGSSFTSEPGFFVSGRYAFLNRWWYLPDLVFQLDGLVTLHDEYVSPKALLSYPIDGATRVMFGREMITDSLSFERRQWDWVGAVEIRIGKTRIWAGMRSIGPVYGSSKEIRLSYFF